MVRCDSVLTMSKQQLWSRFEQDRTFSAVVLAEALSSALSSALVPFTPSTRALVLSLSNMRTYLECFLQVWTKLKGGRFGDSWVLVCGRP